MDFDYNIDVEDSYPANDAKLFFQQLSQLIACGKYRICLHFNEKSAMAFALEFCKYILKEKAFIASEIKKENDALLTKKEVMNLLGVSSTTLWSWMRKKYLVPVKIGRKVFYQKADVENLLSC
ncbi:MAG: helix-turn-helix domain-containing protein [Prevotella sp.]|nr:helix-turn-helix domain-containing protein [Prevotella sp.]